MGQKKIKVIVYEVKCYLSEDTYQLWIIFSLQSRVTPWARPSFSLSGLERKNIVGQLWFWAIISITLLAVLTQICFGGMVMQHDAAADSRLYSSIVTVIEDKIGPAVMPTK